MDNTDFDAFNAEAGQFLEQVTRREINRQERAAKRLLGLERAMQDLLLRIGRETDAERIDTRTSYNLRDYIYNVLENA